MASIPVPFLTGGVSTQPPAVRRPDQVEAADNTIFSVHRGAEKRPGSNFIADLMTDKSDSDYYCHWIERDPNNRFLLMVNTNEEKAFDLSDGSEVDVGYIKNGGVADPDLVAYLRAASSALKMISIADYTIAVNKTQVVAMESSPANTFDAINTAGLTDMFVEAESNYFSDADKMVDAANPGVQDQFYYADAHWPFVSSHPHLETRMKKGYYCGDTGADEFNSPYNLIGYQRRFVNSVEELPGEPRMPGASRNMGQGTEASPFVEVKNSSVGGILGWRKGTIDVPNNKITWERHPPPGVDNCYFDQSTMPIKIVYYASASAAQEAAYTNCTEGQPFFAVDFIDWTPRYNGDDETNPLPSFVGKTISDMVWHRDRLWLAAGEALVSSQAGDYFNFFLDDYTAPIASDPIDVSTSSKQVTNIIWMTPVEAVIILYCNGGVQFELRTDEEELSPFTVKLVQTTEYQISDTVEPVLSGKQVYSISNNEIKPTAYEYYFDARTGGPSSFANRVSAHIEDYLSPNIYEIVGSDEDQVVFYLNGNEIFNYRYHWQGQEKLQSAWSKFVYDSADYIMSGDAMDNSLYLLVRQQTGTDPDKYQYTLLEQPIKPESPSGSMVYVPNLDRKISSTGVYTASTNTTQWTLPTRDYGTSTYKGVLTGDFTNRGSILTPFSVAPSGVNTVIVMFGDYSAHPVIWGREYEYRLELSPVYLRGEDGAMIKGTTLIDYLTIGHRDTGFYRVNITRAGGTVDYQDFNNIALGGTLIGPVTLDDYGEFEVSIHDLRDYYTMEVVSSSPLPVVLSSLDYTVRYFSRRR